MMACGLSSVWSFTLSYQLIYPELDLQTLWVIETARSFGWLVFLSYLLWELFTSNHLSRKWLVVLIASYSLVSLLLVIPHEHFLTIVFKSPIDNINDLRVVFLLSLSVIGISLIEQLFRNTSMESRWTIKYLSLGLGLGFFYDFYLYADALLFKRIDPLIWESRGAINTLIAPLVAVSARRNPDWSVSVFVSKQVVFHTTGILGAGVYLLSMSFIGYYIKDFGGEYGDFFRLIFFVAAIVLLFMLVSSGQLRARLKVFLNKNFFKYQYDYREEWLKLITVLSSSDTDKPLAERVISVMSGIVDSHQGSLWSCNSENKCQSLAGNHIPSIKPAPEEWISTVEFLKQTHWVIDLDEYHYNQAIYGDLQLPSMVLNHQDAWLIVPLIHEENLHSFVLLSHSNSIQKLNWENRDLLLMAGRQAASYMVLNESARQLAEARQFEGFNRLSAFVIHDLKNLIAQLSLVARNAVRHKTNPEFIDDAISTIENSVGKMNRLMLQLKSAGSTEKRKSSDFVKLVEEVIHEKQRQKPLPQLTNRLVDKVFLNAETERLAAVIGHVIQNAQDATPDNGKVEVILEQKPQQLLLTVIDTGTGMDEHFIKNRLFKPFDTTKGLTGMGIGAYECREFILGMHGEIYVDSKPGEGTRFSIVIPLENDAGVKGENIG
jgi:putative PEP-CTERM system histidine kinase